MPQCETCNRSFRALRDLQRHMETSSRHRFTCEACDRNFPTKQGLTQHYVQSPEHAYCQRCDDHFDSLGELLAHYDNDHDYCRPCHKIFDSKQGLHEHRRQKHWYCASCRHVFNTENSLEMHLRTSAIHNERTYKCSGLGCGRLFVSFGDLTLHHESGTCPSGVTRRAVNDLASRADRANLYTNPARLITGSNRQPEVVSTRATPASWNGRAFECILCHKEHHLLSALNAHLNSPAHAGKIFRCPVVFNGCNKDFKTLSGLFQHVERSSCGVIRFQRQMRSMTDSIAHWQGMKMLTL